MLGPLLRCFRIVESLPGYAFPKGNSEFATTILKHFIRQPDQLNVEFNAKFFAEIGEVVKEIGVATLKMNGNDVSLMLNRFNDEAFHPFQIDNFSVYFAGA